MLLNRRAVTEGQPLLSTLNICHSVVVPLDFNRISSFPKFRFCRSSSQRWLKKALCFDWASCSSWHPMISAASTNTITLLCHFTQMSKENWHWIANFSSRSLHSSWCHSDIKRFRQERGMPRRSGELRAAERMRRNTGLHLQTSAPLCLLPSSFQSPWQRLAIGHYPWSLPWVPLCVCVCMCALLNKMENCFHYFAILKKLH